MPKVGPDTTADEVVGHLQDAGCVIVESLASDEVMDRIGAEPEPALAETGTNNTNGTTITIRHLARRSRRRCREGRCYLPVRHLPRSWAQRFRRAPLWHRVALQLRLATPRAEHVSDVSARCRPNVLARAPTTHRIRLCRPVPWFHRWGEPAAAPERSSNIRDARAHDATTRRGLRGARAHPLRALTGHCWMASAGLP